MIEISLMNEDSLMNSPGAVSIFPGREDEYAEIVIEPADELEKIEVSIIEARETGVDVLPAVFMLENCRNLAEAGRTDDYSDAVIHLLRFCGDTADRKGGRLRPVGDYLCFYMN